MLCGLGFGVFISSLLLLAGCAKEEDPNRLPDGQYPMTFTASVEGPTATRATTDNSWTGGEEVAIQVGDEVKKYTAAAATGVLSAANDVTPWYWQTTADIEVTAWHSHNYSSARPTSFTVQADQSGERGYQQSDLLYAAAQQVTFKNSALTFKHLPAKVVVNLKAGDGVMDNDVQSATVSIVNQALTSGAIDTHWVVAQATAGNSIITPNVLPTPTTGYQKSLQAIVVPQQMQNKKFIRVTAGGNDYFYTPATDANLEAGKQYTYNITVKKNGITVTASGATEWGGTITDVTSKDVIYFTASDLKTGDYYYSDGTWSDGGLRKLYSDGTYQMEGTMPVLTNDRTVLGIVMKAGRDVDGDWADTDVYMQKDGKTPMSTIRGYVLALYDANAGNKCQWLSSGMAEGTNTDNSGFYGYSNTQKIIANAAGRNQELMNAFPATYYATTGYETIENEKYASPAVTSGWFLPSVGQCKFWLDNKAVLQGSVRKVTGNDDNWKLYYWSSSESGNSPADRAWCLDFNFGDVFGDNKDFNYYVRSVLAF